MAYLAILSVALLERNYFRLQSKAPVSHLMNELD